MVRRIVWAALSLSFALSLRAQGTWTAMASTPSPVALGSCNVYGGGGFVYLLQGGGSTSFLRYSIAGNSWAAMASTPMPCADGSTIVWDGANTIYLSDPWSVPFFAKYTISTNSWLMLANPGHGRSESLCYVGPNSVYLVNPAGLQLYTISTNTWAPMAAPPVPASIGVSASPYVAAAGGFFVAPVRSGTTWERYNVASNTWTLMAAMPIGITTEGGKSCWDGGSFIYVPANGGTGTGFYQFNIPGNSWTAMAPTPLGYDYCGGAAFDSAGGNVYMTRGFYNAGGGPTSDFWRFAPPVVAPSVPVLLTPANGAFVSTATPTLTWAASSGPNPIANYDVQVANNPGFAPTEFTATVVPTMVTTTALPLGLHYWRVRARDTLGNLSAFSGAFTFTVDTTPPTVPVLSTPANGAFVATATPTLTWVASTDDFGVQNYDVQVANNPGFAPTEFVTTVAGTSVTTPALALGLHYWHVLARDNAGNLSAYSGSFTFTVDTTPPTVPTLVSPANGAVLQTSTVTLIWNASTDDFGVQNYDVQVGSDPTFAGIEFAATVVPTMVTTTALPDGTHYWRVRARDMAGNLSAYSMVFSFTTITSPPQWKTPTPGADTGGGISNTPPSSVDPVLAINPTTSLPGVAWTAPNPVNGNQEIYFRELSAGAWVERAGSGSGGGVDNNATPSQFPSLAYDATGAPVIAWQDSSPGPFSAIYVRRFAGAWNELAGSATGGGISGNAIPNVTPSVAINPVTGQPGVAWTAFSNGSFEVFFREFNGVAWVERAASGSGGGISSNSVNSIDTSLTYDSTGAPVIAWADDTSGNFEIYVLRFNGLAWVDMAGSGTGGGISNTPGVSRHPSVQVDNAGNAYVVWEEDPGNGNAEIFGRRYNGASWVDFGPGSAAGGGISVTPLDSRRPNLSRSTAVDGTFLLVWADFSDPDGMPEIYAKYYASGVWREIGDASARLGGISNSGLPAAHPWCGLTASATPTAYVCWQGGAGSAGQIYVRSLLLAPAADSPKEVVVGGGYGAGGQYRVFGNGVVAPPYAPLDLRTEPWVIYNAANGTLHPACGDVEGTGIDDVVLGLGTYTQSGGWVAVMRDTSIQFTLLAWLRFPWSQYNAANGAVFPACGDLDNDGRADIVLGQGSYPGGGGGWCAIFGDQATGFAFQGWIQGGFASYDGANGEVHPACGDVNGDGRNRIVMGFGQGSGGLVQVRDDRLHGYAGVGSLTYANSAYDGQNGTTWPAVAGATAHAGPEVIVGPGSGGSGIVYVYGSASGGFGQIASAQVPWGAYDSQQGELRVAAGTTDASGYPQVVAGLGTYPSNGGWLFVFGNVTGGSATGTWFRYTNGNPNYNFTNGETFPAVGELR